MFNNQDFMVLNDVGSLGVKDQDLVEIARNDQDRLINGLKWTYDYFEHDHQHQTDNFHLQIVPEIHEEEESSKKDSLVVTVPDEESETGDHHYHIDDYSYSSDNRCYLKNKDRRTKRRCIQISSDEESSHAFTREFPTVTRKGSKRRRRDKMMSNKMRTLQQLVPNCHKMDKVSVLDKTIEYMKDLQLQLKVMSRMGINHYIPPVRLDFGIHNYLVTAMAMAGGQNPANQTTSSSPLVQALNWPLRHFPNLSFAHSSNQSFLATQAYSPQCLHGLVPCFPSFPDFMGRL